MFEEDVGFLAIPIDLSGLAVCMVFWVGMYYLSIGVSKLIAPKAYAALSPNDKISWNNYAWSTTHGIIGFIVSPHVILILNCMLAEFSVISGRLSKRGRHFSGPARQPLRLDAVAALLRAAHVSILRCGFHSCKCYFFFILHAV